MKAAGEVRAAAVTDAKDGGRGMNQAEIAEFKRLTEVALPALAREHRWPIRLDHCFKRICLDHAYGNAWFKHCKRPAERNIAPEPLVRAVGCAREIAREGLPALNRLNRASLGYRGKLREPGL